MTELQTHWPHDIEPEGEPQGSSFFRFSEDFWEQYSDLLPEDGQACVVYLGTMPDEFGRTTMQLDACRRWDEGRPRYDWQLRTTRDHIETGGSRTAIIDHVTTSPHDDLVMHAYSGDAGLRPRRNGDSEATLTTILSLTNDPDFEATVDMIRRARLEAAGRRDSLRRFGVVNLSREDGLAKSLRPLPEYAESMLAGYVSQAKRGFPLGGTADPPF